MRAERIRPLTARQALLRFAGAVAQVAARKCIAPIVKMRRKWVDTVIVADTISVAFDVAAVAST